MSKIKPDRPAPAKKPADPSSSKAISKAEIEIFSKKIGELIGKDPKKAATLLTEWIRKDSKNKLKKAG